MPLLEDFESYQPDLGTPFDTESLVPDITHSEEKSPDDIPLFALQPVRCDPATKSGLREMAVCNNIICIGLANNHVIRLSLDQPDLLINIKIPSDPDQSQIHKMFMDPTGNHTIISMTSAANYYLHRSSKEVKFIKSMKGMVIESVGWDRTNTNPNTSKSILFGTSTGRIFETTLELDKQKDPKLLYYLGEESSQVTGLAFERFPSEPNKLLILVSTPSRIYQFIGGPTFSQVFENYANVHPRFTSFPGDITHSVLQLHGKSPTTAADYFAWITGPGISYSALSYGSQMPGDFVAEHVDLLLYPEDPRQTSKFGQIPISLVVTDFHLLLLYTTKLQAISRLSQQVVWEERFSDAQQLGHIRGITKDPVNGTIWLYTNFQMFEVTLFDEDRNVWKLYLEKQEWEQAEIHCKTPAQKDKVWTSRADQYYSEGRFVFAATYYGLSSRPFEEITLKFIRMGNRDALKTYLLKKLDNLGPTEVTQRTLLTTWLVEIYLNKLNELKDDNRPDLYKFTQDEFKLFIHSRLQTDKDSFDQATTYNLISSHGRIEELLFFAKEKGDFELVINHYIQRREYLNALQALQEQSNEELYYHFAPVLMHYVPYHTVEVLMRGPSTLEPRKLIPALMRYDSRYNPPSLPNCPHQAIRYLEHCVNVLKNRDPTVHNYLISLYAQTGDEQSLNRFLLNTDVYDREFALRTCLKDDKKHACVIIYSYMGEYEEAVELALKVGQGNIDLAIAQAKLVEDDEERRKKLWLRIGQYVVEKEEDIKKAMAFLNQTEGLVKIEDILKFFRPFVLIDDFKDEICAALEEYNRRITELKSEMDAATRSADELRLDIKNLRNKYGYVGQSQPCDICGYSVMTRQFYMFPCLHVYHADCLQKEVMVHLDDAEQRRVLELENAIATQAPLKTVMESVDESAASVGSVMTETEKLKTALDDIIASECLLCGSIMINTIDLPFYNPSDNLLADSWKI